MFASMEELEKHLNGLDVEILDDGVGDGVDDGVGDGGGKSKKDLIPGIITEMKLLGIPEPERELSFHDHRKWRLDMAWPEYKVAFEIEGGIWMKTKTGRSKGHAHPIRFMEDCEKYSHAAILGWCVIRATPQQTGQAYGWVMEALLIRGCKIEKGLS